MSFGHVQHIMHHGWTAGVPRSKLNPNKCGFHFFITMRRFYKLESHKNVGFLMRYIKCQNLATDLIRLQNLMYWSWLDLTFFKWIENESNYKCISENLKSHKYLYQSKYVFWFLKSYIIKYFSLWLHFMKRYEKLFYLKIE